MGFTFDDTITLPTNKADGGRASVPHEFVASDANLNAAATLDLRSAVRGGDYHGLRDMSGGLPSVAPSGEARLVSSAGKPLVSGDGKNYRRLFWTIDASEYGVVAGDSSENSQALQDVFNWARDEITAERQVVILLPPGKIRYTTPAVFYGTGSMAPILLGAKGRGDNYSSTGASILFFDGDAGAEMFFAQGLNAGHFKDVMFDGNYKARCVFVYSATTFADRAVLDAANDVVWEHCRFQNVQIATPGTILVELGTDPALTGGATYEAATWLFKHCTFRGENPASPSDYANMKAIGVKNMSGGNAKCGRFEDCSWQWCDKAMDNASGSAQVVVTNTQIADCRTAFVHGAGELIVSGFDIEGGHVDDFRLLTGTGTGAKCAIQDGECMGFLAGSTGTVIDYVGALKLDNIAFGNANHSVSGDPDVTNPFVIKINVENSTGSGLELSRCTFDCCDTNYVPVVNSTGSLAPIAGAYGGESAFRLKAFNNSNKTTVSGTSAPLKDFDSTASRLFQASLNGPLEFSILSGGDASVSYAQNKTLVPIDATAGDKTFTLPTASTCPGRVYVVTKADASGHTVTVNAKVLSSQFDSVWVESTGSAWLNLKFV